MRDREHASRHVDLLRSCRGCGHLWAVWEVAFPCHWECVWMHAA